MSIVMDPIDRAREGDVEYFRGVPLSVIQTAVDHEGVSVFSHAVIANKLECCKVIYERCPSQLYHHSTRDRYNAMQHAAFRGFTAIVKFLIWANCQKDKVGEETDVESGRRREEMRNMNLLTMADSKGFVSLHQAVMSQIPEVVKLLIEADHGRDTLRMVNWDNNTPLHMAVEDKKLEIAGLLIEAADPDLEYGFNRFGDTPLMIAMKEAKGGNGSGMIRRLLMEKQPDKLKMGAGENGWTPLHHAACQGNLVTVDEIIKLCPSSIEVADKHGQNFLHLAAKFEHAQLVQHIIGTKEIPPAVLNGQDIYGHTPLHVAALSENQAVTSCLIYDRRVKKTTINNQGQHVLEAITFEYDRGKAEVFGITDRLSQYEWKNQSDFDLVVGALIAAVSFTAGITVPGGYISSGGPNQGTAILSKEISFIAFVMSNNLALMFSLYAVFSHFCTRRMRRKEDISYQLNVAQYCTLGAIFAMMVAFIMGSYTVLANSKPLAIAGCASCCCFFAFATRPMWKILMHQTSSPRPSVVV